MMIGVKGKQLCTGNPNAPDRRTGMVIPVYPPNFVAGGIIMFQKPLSLEMLRSNDRAEVME